ncbi:MAG: proteobacterial dedicated sortase system response regulator [Pseudomonadota bacterium]|nr:proteobacterial dedicated sortase system response regulator [Pseudomonadales bacterium]MDY6922294.1 proteobacterial dedicated sortase system response regulator [Pseudomonadota bacterium]
MSKHIALIEDEAAIRENYQAFLSAQGYRVSTYASRPEALAALRQRLPDMAVIDIGLQDEIEGGFELCRELRHLAPRLPILFLTARDSELDAISGLRLGADDYLTKDISLPHLAARITALFRRLEALRQPEGPNQPLQRGPLRLDLDRLHASWHQQPLELTLTEFWILHALAQRPGHVKNRQQLMDAASVVLDDNTITSHIKRIRRKFQQIDPAFDAIQTVYGMGYRWHAAVPET